MLILSDEVPKKHEPDVLQEQSSTCFGWVAVRGRKFPSAGLDVQPDQMPIAALCEFASSM